MKRIRLYILLFFPCILLGTLHPQTVGQRFIFSLPENATNEQLHEWIGQTKPAGVMLLASHFRNRTGTKQLISFLQQEATELSLPHLIITVDWEGGIVSRPNETGGFFSVPSPWALAQSGPSACFLAGSLIGSQCRSIGANMDFAPLADSFDPINHILATRCFSDNPATIAESCIAFSQGLLSHGVLPVVKHFPGLGLGKGDTHFVSVGITVSNAELEKNVTPFKAALQAGVPCVMTTHAQFDQFGHLPTTLSPAVVKYLKSYNDKALLITDDFSMKAVQNGRTVDQAVQEAWDAGFHLIIFSGKPAEQIELVETLEKQYQTFSQQQAIDFKNACDFIQQFKRQHIVQQPPAQPIINEQDVAQDLALRCIKVEEPLPSLAGKNVHMFSVDLPGIRTPEKWFIQNDQSYLAGKLGQAGIKTEERILDALKKESSAQLEQALAACDKNTMIILQTFFYANNEWNTIQKEWLKLLSPYQDQLIVVSLGHPFERLILPDAYILNLGSFNKPLLNRASQLLVKKTLRD